MGAIDWIKQKMVEQAAQNRAMLAEMDRLEREGKLEITYAAVPNMKQLGATVMAMTAQPGAVAAWRRNLEALGWELYQTIA